MDTDGSEGTTPAPENRWDRFVKGFALGAAGLVLLWGVLAALVYWTSSDDYDEAASGDGLSNQTTTTGGPSETSPPGDVDGAAVADSAGCTACHSSDGSAGVGPTWAGIAGTERPLEDGSSVLADPAYLLESIVDPNVKIVAGYAAGLMPQNFGDTLSDQELAALVIYIESLSG